MDKALKCYKFPEQVRNTYGCTFRDYLSFLKPVGVITEQVILLLTIDLW